MEKTAIWHVIVWQFFSREERHIQVKVFSKITFFENLKTTPMPWIVFLYIFYVNGCEFFTYNIIFKKGKRRVKKYVNEYRILTHININW